MSFLRISESGDGFASLEITPVFETQYFVIAIEYSGLASSYNSSESVKDERDRETSKM